MLILPPNFESKFDQNNPQNRRTLNYARGLLIKSGQFSLPGKKALLKSDVEYEIIFIDAAETPVERPKKKSGKRRG